MAADRRTSVRLAGTRYRFEVRGTDVVLCMEVPAQGGRPRQEVRLADSLFLRPTDLTVDLGLEPRSAA
jgi:hypothetical protein